MGRGRLRECSKEFRNHRWHAAAAKCGHDPLEEGLEAPVMYKLLKHNNAALYPNAIQQQGHYCHGNPHQGI